ncbi:hypothetical protein ACET3X_006382 [Alternaria dauci]|uniref:Protein kinase domain-containing protein n=1 Tax=Alternaria dauci TaxID=48095 RepID=A0ABR3UDI4_9PLEO
MHQPIVDRLVNMIQYCVPGPLQVLYRSLTLSANPIKLLAKEIGAALCTNSDGQEFLPEDKIRYFTQEEQIRDAPRLFLILVLMESEALEERLKVFQDNNFVDSVLPIRLDQDNIARTLRVQDPPILVQYSVLTQWEQKERRLFVSDQWCYSAPVFGTSKFHLQLAAVQRLPFLEVAQQPASSGYFGEVTKVVVHAKHIDPSLKLSTFPWPIRESGNRDTPPQIEAITVAVKKTKEGDDDPKYSRAAFFDKEVRNLKQLRQYKSPHLIKPIAGYQIGQNRCLMFPWADGGNLGDYWKNFSPRARSKPHVLWQLHQFREICAALEELHAGNCRHGDLKPENILWFDPEDKDGGSLQIADLGLATFHEKEANTRNRQGMPTQTPSGTSRYEPPEMDAQRNTNEARSRQYDIWSLGCVVFELLLWLVYGPSGITVFRDNTPYFWQRGNRREHGRYIVHEYVVAVMDALDTHFKPDSAYKDLLDLVRHRLLVVKFSANYDDVADDCRASASKVHQCFADIYQRCTPIEQDYLEPLKEILQYPEAELNRRAPQRNEAQCNEVHEKDGKLAVPEQRPIIKPALQSMQPPVEDSIPGPTQSPTPEAPDIPNPEKLLEFRLNIRKPTFHQHLGNQNSQASQASNHHEGFTSQEIINLRADDSHVGVKDGPNLLSLYRALDSEAPVPGVGQLGLPQLFNPNTPEFFALLKEWIRVCDSDHDQCQREDAELTMPTRLIEVGKRLRLVDTVDIEPSRYAALSHCWGRLQKHERFCTYKSNITERKAGIHFDALPRTFRDAVTVARGLSMDYIWIDSLCIIQDDESDWQSEAGKMEQVFSAAYLTIGASSATSSLQGFLADRHPRSVVKVQSDKSGTVYACVDIDDFHNDVELSPLNNRGWVLQERALSRRTIFFTSIQVYWECGAGIHCETLTRLRNSKVALLGDANFPASAVAHYKDGRQLLIQDLYERYSSLAFTEPADRPVAILGLQKRLSRAFNTKAAHGLFEAYFARGLLWRRRDWQRMERIVQPSGCHVPSWSSLSKEGSIKYLDTTDQLRFKETEWATNDFENPFTISIGSAGVDEIVSFRGLARRIHISQMDMLVYVKFDGDDDFEVNNLRCVIIGRDKGEGEQVSLRSHVLVISQSRSPAGSLIWERVGVASLNPSAVDGRGSWVDIY